MYLDVNPTRGDSTAYCKRHTLLNPTPTDLYQEQFNDRPLEFSLRRKNRHGNVYLSDRPYPTTSTWSGPLVKPHRNLNWLTSRAEIRSWLHFDDVTRTTTTVIR